MDLEKKETAADLSDSKTYFAIYANQEGLHISIHGGEMDLLSMIGAALSEHEEARNMFRAIIKTLDESESHDPIPPEEIN